MSFRNTQPTILVNMLLEPAHEITGIARYTFFLLEAMLRRDRMRLVLVSSWRRDRLPPALRDSKLETVTLSYVRSQPLNILTQSARVARLMRRTGADIEFNPCAIGTSGFLHAAWPRLVTVHDLYKRTHAAQYQRRHRLWWNLFFPRSAATAQRLVCVSQNTRRDLLAHYPTLASKALVVNSASGLTADGPPVPSKERKRQLLFVANITPNKGAATLAAAADLLRRRGADIEILHVGQDPHGILAEAVRNHEPGLPLRSLGRVTDDALKDLYRTSSLLLFPSSYEGFGLPIVEAQGFGTPVVCSDIPVLREVAGDGAVYVPPGHAEAFADQILRLMSDGQDRSRLARAAIENSARFSWDNTARGYEAAFADMLSARTTQFIYERAISSIDRA